MIPSIDFFLPSGAQVLGLFALLVWCAGLMALGALVGGAKRMAECDLMYGWPVVVIAFILAAFISSLPFTYVAYAMFALSIVAAVLVYRRDGYFIGGDTGRMIVLGLPMVIMITGLVPAQWDEFTNWLPKAMFMLDHDTFPRSGGPKSHSLLPGYPNALPLMIYLPSRLSGLYVENAGALFNLFLHLAFGLVIARLIRAAARSGRADAPWAMTSAPLGWGYCALGALATTALNPAFVPKIVFTSYADAGTAMTLGAGAVLGWYMICALAEDDGRGTNRLAWQLGVVLAAMISLKQVNIVLLVALVAGLSLVALRDPLIKLRAFWRPMALALIFPISMSTLR